jgi:hypothetical protein
MSDTMYRVLSRTKNCNFWYLVQNSRIRIGHLILEKIPKKFPILFFDGYLPFGSNIMPNKQLKKFQPEYLILF